MISWSDPGFSESHFRACYESPWSFEETVARIATASGQPVKSDDRYKTSVNFVGVFAGQRFTLYDYKEDRTIHIGGSNALDVAKEYYDEKKGHGWSR